ncbi:MAG: MBL fold metallo-hydrolase, partial [Dehalococcoidia bacterium]
DVTPERVDTIVFTHLHADHVGWNCTKVGDEYHPTFPNARYILNRAEFDRWSDDPAGYLRRHLKPLSEAGQLDLVDDSYEPAPGMALLSTPGHTAGHVSVLLYSGGEGGVITGDALHHPVEVEHPDWSPSADDDGQLSATSRGALLDRVEAEGFLLLGGHFPAPHTGHVVRVGPRRVFRAMGG